MNYNTDHDMVISIQIISIIITFGSNGSDNNYHNKYKLNSEPY